MFRCFFKQERCEDEKLQSKYACADQPSAPGCRTDGAINRCMGSVSATSGPDTERQVPDEILQNFGMKTSFSKDVPKLSYICIKKRKGSGAKSFLENMLNDFCPNLKRLPGDFAVTVRPRDCKRRKAVWVSIGTLDHGHDFVVRRVQEIRRKAEASLLMCLIDLQKA